jgi:hypothetical protein
MDTYLRQSLEALGLPLVVPEPEVVKAIEQSVQCNALAIMIERALSGEPLLKIERDGATITVREVGGTGTMKFTVEAV